MRARVELAGSRLARPGRKAIVIGAGPAGALAALVLAQNNYEVEVCQLLAGQPPTPTDPENTNLPCHTLDFRYCCTLC